MLRFIYYCAECHYAERRDLFIIMQNVIVLRVIMLNVVVPAKNVIPGMNTLAYFTPTSVKMQTYFKQITIVKDDRN